MSYGVWCWNSICNSWGAGNFVSGRLLWRGIYYFCYCYHRGYISKVKTIPKMKKILLITLLFLAGYMAWRDSSMTSDSWWTFLWDSIGNSVWSSLSQSHSWQYSFTSLWLMNTWHIKAFNIHQQQCMEVGSWQLLPWPRFQFGFFTHYAQERRRAASQCSNPILIGAQQNQGTETLG